MVIVAKQGAVIPLINWGPNPVKGLDVWSRRIRLADSTKITLASGRPVRTRQQNGGLVCTLDLDVADALILRP
jgi:hypothetical protein